jgi:hypothetical protein
MALGNTAGLTQATVNAQIAADAAYLRGAYDWVKRKFSEYNANISTVNQQSAAGFTLAADQNQLNVFIADLNRIILLFEGGTPSVSNIVNDLAVISGIG